MALQFNPLLTAVFQDDVPVHKGTVSQLFGQVREFVNGLETGLQDVGVWTLGAVGGTAAAMTGTLDFTPDADTVVLLVPPVDNSGPVTLAVNGGPARSVTRTDSTNLQAGDLKQGQPVMLRLTAGGDWRVVASGLLWSAIMAAVRSAGVPSVASIAGTGAAITGTLPFNEVPGETVAILVPPVDNTGPVTLKLGSGPVRSIMANDSTNLSAGDLRAGQAAIIRLSAAGVWRVVGVLRSEITQAIAVEATARAAGDAALQTEMRTRRVATASSTSFATTSFPLGTDTVVRRQATGGWALWVSISAPATPDPLIQQQDKDGIWWQRAWLSTDTSTGLATETTNRIIGDAQMGTVTLTGVGGTGDAITAAVPSQLTAIGVSAANLREIMWLPTADNTGAATINIDGVGAVELRGPDNLTLTAGALKAGRWARAVKNGSRWNHVSPTVRLADLANETAARAAADTAEATARAAADTAEATARAAGDAALSKRLDPATISRGDSMVLAEINGVPVLGLAADGTLIAKGAGSGITMAEVEAAIEAAIEAIPSGGTGGATPASPDLAGDVDAWEVWQDGDLVYFTANLWGDHPRQYVRRSTGEAWANGPSRARLRLAYGDDLANAATDRGPVHFAHVATLADGAGQDGLNGDLPSQDATDLARAGLGYPGLVGDQWLARRPGSLPLVGARSEAVAGATLAQLRTGQPMLNLKRAVTQFTSVLGPYNRTAQVDAVSILHGAADDSATYAADLLTLTDDVIRETGALSVHVVQPAGTWQRGNWTSALGTVQAWRDRGALPLVVVSPLYWTGLRAGTLATPDAVSMTMLAELDAIAGNDWFCPAAFLAARSGTTINVDFEVMPGATLTATPEGLAHSATTITGVQVVAHPVTGAVTRLAVTLASAVAGRLTYRRAASGADNTRLANYGAAGIADSWSAASIVAGRTLRRPAYAFDIEVN